MIQTTEELADHIRSRLAVFKAPEEVVTLLTQHVGFFLKQAPLDPHSSFFDFEGKSSASAALIGVPKDQFVGAALKQPSLFYQSPQTLNRNVEASAALMGVRKDQFVGAALKQPQLFYQSPETLNGNIEASAALMGISKSQFVGAALKQPQLFYQSPETIARHATLAGDLYRGGHVTLNPAFGKPAHAQDISPVVNWMCETFPMVLTLADDNFHLRQELASLRGKPISGNILTIPRHRAEREVASLLGHHDPAQAVYRGGYDPAKTYDNPKTQAERHGRLCHLIERGLIKGIALAEGEAPVLAHRPTVQTPSVAKARPAARIRQAVPAPVVSKPQRTPAELAAAFRAYRARQTGGTQP